MSSIAPIQRPGRLPNEILDEILGYMDFYTAKELRLSCKVFAKIAARLIYSEVHLVLLSSSMNKLFSIAGHDEYRHLVNKLVFHGELLRRSRCYTDFKRYHREVGTEATSKDLKRAWKYQEPLQTQQERWFQSRYRDTQYSADQGWPEKFRDRIDDIEYCDEPLRFEEAVGELINLRTIVIDRIKPRETRAKPIWSEVESKTLQIWRTHDYVSRIYNKTAEVDDALKSQWLDGVESLAAVLSTLHNLCKPVDNLTFSTTGPAFWVCDQQQLIHHRSDSYTAPRLKKVMEAGLLDPYKSCFTTLKSLDMTVSNDAQDRREVNGTISALAVEFLQQASLLEELRFGWGEYLWPHGKRGPHPQKFNILKEMEAVTFPVLRHLSLSISTTVPSLLSFLDRHSSTVRSLSLSRCYINQNDTQDGWNLSGRAPSWTTVLYTLPKILDLENFDLWDLFEPQVFHWRLLFAAEADAESGAETTQAVREYVLKRRDIMPSIEVDG